MTKPKALDSARARKRIDDQLATLDRWYTTILTDEVGYDPTLVGDVATKLLSDLAVLVLLRNGLRHRRRQLLTYDDEELELVDIPSDPLLIGWAEHDEAVMEQRCSVPELLVQRLRQARAKDATSL
jgi:hypothetical protein